MSEGKCRNMSLGAPKGEQADNMSLKTMIAASPIAAVISDPRLPDNPIVECNAAFSALTGYGPEEILGRNCRFLAGPGTEPDMTEYLRAAFRAQRRALGQFPHTRQTRTPQHRK